MKKILFLTVVVGFAGCSQSQEDGIKFSGNFEQLPAGGYAYVELIGENGVEPFDTLDVDTNGSFTE